MKITDKAQLAHRLPATRLDHLTVKTWDAIMGFSGWAALAAAVAAVVAAIPAIPRKTAGRRYWVAGAVCLLVLAISLAAGDAFQDHGHGNSGGTTSARSSPEVTANTTIAPPQSAASEGVELNLADMRKTGGDAWKVETVTAKGVSYPNSLVLPDCHHADSLGAIYRVPRGYHNLSVTIGLTKDAPDGAKARFGIGTLHEISLGRGDTRPLTVPVIEGQDLAIMVHRSSCDTTGSNVFLGEPRLIR
jgi:hypothetical protein